MGWDPLPETVYRMAGFLLLQNLHFHHPWWSERYPNVDDRIYSVSQATGSNSFLMIVYILPHPDNSAKLTGQQLMPLT